MNDEADIDRLADAADACVYLRPIVRASAAGTTSGRSACLPSRAEDVELIVRSRSLDATRRVAMTSERATAWSTSRPDRVAACIDGLMKVLASPRPRFAGFPPDRPRLMGVVNVTPDSFSDGGQFLDPSAAVDRILTLETEGASIIDLGAESTRPGAAPISSDEEIRRLAPVLERVAGRTGAVLSVDTRNAATMRYVLAAGVAVINDVSALTEDPDSLEIVAGSEASIVLMHKQGQPSTMNEAPRYDDPVLDVYDYLEARIAACEAAGIDRARLVVDPGIAFGKSTAHSLAILNAVSIFHGLGCGVLIGVSRKGLIGAADERLPPARRLPGSLAAALWAIGQGVQWLRVHDVAETGLAVDVWRVIEAGASEFGP